MGETCCSRPVYRNNMAVISARIERPRTCCEQAGEWPTKPFESEST